VARKFLTPIAPPALSSDPSNGTTGSIYYNTSLNALKYYNGSAWTVIGSGGGGGGGTGTSNALEVLSDAPSSPSQGRIYFDSTENTIKIYNGTIWYDVAGPKELLDHTHFAGEGGVRTVDYGNYVEYGNYIVSMDGGTATTNFSSTPNDDIIDGGVG
jgi:hypothetical protein